MSAPPIAEAKQAEQKAITVEAQGKANATQAKWDQETIKAKAVTLAQQEKEVAETNATKEANVAAVAADRDANVAKVAAQRDQVVAETQATQRRNVANLDKDAAEFTRQQNILLGQGEAERARLVLEANGALTQKLDAYVRVQEAFAGAIAAYKGNLVPTIMFGGGTAGTPQAGAGIEELLQLLTAKAAGDLNLNIGVTK